MVCKQPAALLLDSKTSHTFSSVSRFPILLGPIALSFPSSPTVFEEQFADLDEKISDWYKLVQCFPNYVLHYHDGETVTLSTDMAQMKLEIEKWEGKDGWARFLEFMNEVSRATACWEGRGTSDVSLLFGRWSGVPLPFDAARLAFD